ncbi:hypothetical protein V6R21_23820 [Limibacter armeniacum]|uniref:hypothetical protein n=1 Tax=Limibacter armeniacum TaxID=466084 RepID=UPI002FE5318C
MQNILKISGALLCFLLILNGKVSHAQNNETLLGSADSLFESGKYTSALKEYNLLLDKKKIYTPQMLLRMAYIHEADGDYTEALYFLNMYYGHTADRRVMQKMSDIANKHQLSGYKFTDYEYFGSVFHRNYMLFMVIGSIIGVALLALVFYKKHKGEPYLPAAISLALLMVVFLWLFNFGFNDQKAIVRTEHAFVADAPSAGAKRLYKLEKGERVDIKAVNDIWYKVSPSNDKEVFVRKNNLIVVE